MNINPEDSATAANPSSPVVNAAGSSVAMPPDVSATSTLSLKDAFDMYQKQADSVHKIWAYFQAVSIAVVAYALGGQLPATVDGTRIVFACAYGVFAFSNLLVLYHTQKEMYDFVPVVREIAASVKGVGNKLVVNAFEPWTVVFFHVFVSAAVVLATLFLGYPTSKPSAQNIIGAVLAIEHEAQSVGEKK